jgi:predicted metal-binding transcription factor (methanogenesis marker protein 9)
MYLAQAFTLKQRHQNLRQARTTKRSTQSKVGKFVTKKDYLCYLKLNKMKNLTPEELESFKTARDNYYSLRGRLADIAIAEERLKNDKQSTLINISIAEEQLNKVNNEVHEKYGDGNVNMQTGEIS